MTIRVIICDDQDLVRDGLQAILSTVAGIEVVGEAHNGNDAVDLAVALEPDVVLMDLKMPGMTGAEATRRIRDRVPTVAVLVLTTYDSPEWLTDAIRSGASGYLLKDTPRDRLVEAIKGTAAGQTHVDPGIAGQLFASVAGQGPRPEPTAIGADLSDRELDVLRLLGRGLTNAEIADRLFLSEGTVRNYVSAVLGKLDVADRTQAAVIAIRHGLADTEREDRP